MITAENLADEFLDYFNNYLTVEAFARDRRIDVATAHTIIERGRYFHEERVRLAPYGGILSDPRLD